MVEYTYDSWGKILAVTGDKAASVGKNQPFRYRGYVYDNETQWYYLQSRYYDPSLGRFVSSDVYLSTGRGVLGHNAYAYCGNNPVIRADSQGKFFFTIIGAAVGGIVGGITSAVTGGNFWEGALSGAASGAIAGAAADIVVATAATGGAALAIIAVGGAVSGVAGEAISSAFAPEDEKSTIGDYVVSAVAGAGMNMLSFGMGDCAKGLSGTIKKAGEVVKQVVKKGVTKKIAKIASSFIGENAGMELLNNTVSAFARKYRRIWMEAIMGAER